MFKKPLKIAWISDFPIEWLLEPPEKVRALPRRHPATWQMVLLSEFQKNPDLQVHVILFRHRIERSFTFEQKNTIFHVLKMPPWLRVASVFWADTLLIEKACRKIQPDILHSWGMEKAAGLVGLRTRRPHLMTVQGLFGWYKEHVEMVAYDSFIERLERRYLPRMPLVTTESRFAVNYLTQRFPGLRIHQAEHAPNHSFFEVHRQPALAPLHFISVGGLGFRKGTDLLMEALERLLPELQFRLTIICGPSPAYIDSLRAKVSPALWQKIEFKHHILPHEVAHELASPAIMLLPTRADVSPNAVKEAVVAGLPVVASEVGGIPDYVAHGKNGVLFRTGNLDEFTTAIRDACRHPLFGQGKVDEAKLAQARQYLAPARMAENFLAAYRIVLGGSGRN